jgi:hypothetical protein
MVDHEVAASRDFSGPEFDLCGIHKNNVMAEGMKPFLNRFRAAAGSADRMHNRNLHDHHRNIYFIDPTLEFSENRDRYERPASAAAALRAAMWTGSHTLE